jgi:hypothetical protein
MPRKPAPPEIEHKVLHLCRRRCCLCYGLRNDLSEKQGQIAHLDRIANHNEIENLAFLCLPHHDQYDSRTSQSKGLTGREVKHFRQDLHDLIVRDPESLNANKRSNEIRVRQRSTAPHSPNIATFGDNSPVVVNQSILSDDEYVKRAEKRPVVEIDFRFEYRRRQPPDYVADLTMEVINRGEWPIRDLSLQVTEYTLERRAAIVGMTALGNSRLISERIEPKGGSSGLRSIRDTMPVRFEKLGLHDQGSRGTVPVNELFYALRITFFHPGSGKRYVAYLVVNAKHPYLFPGDGNAQLVWGKRDSSVPDTLLTDFLERPKKVILEDQRQRYLDPQDEEYKPAPSSRPDD